MGVKRLFVMRPARRRGAALLLPRLRDLLPAGLVARGAGGLGRRRPLEGALPQGRRAGARAAVRRGEGPRLPHPPLPRHRRLLAAGRPRRHGPRRGLLPRQGAAGGDPRRALRVLGAAASGRSSPSRTARGGSSTPPPRSTERDPWRTEARRPFALRLHRLERRARQPARHRGGGGAPELPPQPRALGGARRRAPRRPDARPAHRLARDEAVADEERVRLQRLPRAAHAARLDPRLRRVPPPRPLRRRREGPRVRRLHRDREPAPDPAHQQHPRLRQHRVGAQDLPLRALRRRARWSARPCKTFEVRLRQDGFHIRLEGAGPPLPPARIDAGAIVQSLSNLLDNAVKYSRGDATSSSRSAATAASSSSPSATRGSASRATSSARSSTASTA